MKDKKLRKLLGVTKYCDRIYLNRPNKWEMNNLDELIRSYTADLRSDVDAHNRHIVQLHKTINALLKHLGLEVENIPETPPRTIIQKRPKEKKP